MQTQYCFNAIEFTSLVAGGVASLAVGGWLAAKQCLRERQRRRAWEKHNPQVSWDEHRDWQLDATANLKECTTPQEFDETIKKIKQP